MFHSGFQLVLVAHFSIWPLAVLQAGPTPADRTKDEPAPAEAAGAEIQVQFIDDSSMKLRVMDEKLELATRHGVLKIAMAEIRRIEFATRTPPEVTQKIVAAVSKLGHPDSKVRDKATAELRDYGSRAYPALLDAAKGTDAEVVRRAELLIQAIRKAIPAGELVTRASDVIHTDDSRITGKLSASSLHVKTFQFGEQVLRVSDIRSIGPTQAAKTNEYAMPGPPNLLNYQGQFGTELSFSVTGANNNSVWGSDVYTLDSSLASAAVHAGQVQIGQTAVVKVRIVQPPGQFAGATRNGVTSTPFGPFPAGAYEFIEK